MNYACFDERIQKNLPEVNGLSSKIGPGGLGLSYCWVICRIYHLPSIISILLPIARISNLMTVGIIVLAHILPSEVMDVYTYHNQNFRLICYSDMMYLRNCESKSNSCRSKKSRSKGGHGSCCNFKKLAQISIFL